MDEATCGRNPFDEAECGRHYARAMASWAAVPALTGFGYSGVDKTMTFAAKDGRFFWSNGYAWGSCCLKSYKKDMRVELSVLYGELALSGFILRDFGCKEFDKTLRIKAAEKAKFTVSRGNHCISDKPTLKCQ